MLGLPWGGVPVAFEVAAALAAPLDVIVVAKLGESRSNPSWPMGAIGEVGARVLNTAVTGPGRISDDALAAVEEEERTKLEARVARYRRGRARVDEDTTPWPPPPADPTPAVTTADNLYEQAGDDAMVDRITRRYVLTGTTPTPAGVYWGNVQTTAADMASLLN